MGLDVPSLNKTLVLSADTASNPAIPQSHAEVLHRQPSFLFSNMTKLVEGTTAVLASERVMVDGEMVPATILISSESGKITALYRGVIPEDEFPGVEYKDYSPRVLLPGLVDAHVHLNEPGRTEWEGFWTGTQAAAQGGVTTVIDMPLNAIPPTTDVPAFEEKIRAAKGQCWVDVGFYGGLIPGNEEELKKLVHAGVRGFKGFLIDSGVPEFPALDVEDMRKAIVELKDEPTVVMFHAEMEPEHGGTGQSDSHSHQDPVKYSTFLSSRPPSFEIDAINKVVEAANLAPDLHLHIVHLSAADAIPLLREARRSGVKVTAETCFHYLTLAADDIKDGDTRFKCCPPIREQSNQDELWEELVKSETEDGVLKTVVSDHSPCTPHLKSLPKHIQDEHVPIDSAHMPPHSPTDPVPNVNAGDFLHAWGGISGLGLGLSLLHTQTEKRGITLGQIVQWCSVNTAEQVGLGHRKGRVAVGYDADVVVFDPDAEHLVKPEELMFKNKISVYTGMTLKGLVMETFVGGSKVYQHSTGFDSLEPVGKLLLEKRIR